MNVLKSLKGKESKIVISNIFYLTLINIANFVLPLLTFPYLVRVIGIDKFGLLSFATSIITYFLIFTDYGFNITATRLISINRDDKEKINEIFSSVIILKIFLLSISMILLLLMVFIIPKLRSDAYIYFLTFGLVIGQVLFPVWYFQGIEKMKIISILNIISKIFFTSAIFIFVKSSEDFYLVPLFSSLGFILIGIISIIICIFKYNIKIVYQSISVLKYYLIEGWHIFISNITVTLYTTSTVTILGFFTNNTIVGYYSSADRIISAIRGLIGPVTQAIFPYLSRKVDKDPKEILQINRKLLLYFSPLFLLLTTILFFGADYIIELLFKIHNKEAALVLKILSFIPTIIFIHAIYALFTMIIFKRTKAYSKIIISAALLNLVIAFTLIPLYGHIGAAICILFIEIYLMFRYIIYTNKNSLKIL